MVRPLHLDIDESVGDLFVIFIYASGCHDSFGKEKIFVMFLIEWKFFVGKLYQDHDHPQRAPGGRTLNGVGSYCRNGGSQGVHFPRVDQSIIEAQPALLFRAEQQGDHFIG